MRQMHARRVAERRIVVQREDLAWAQRDAAFGELADAQLRPLQVGEYADRPAELFLDLAYTADQCLHRGMVGVAHVDAEDVGACLEQLPDRLLVG